MGRLTRTEIERRAIRADRRIRHKPTSVRTIAILIYRDRGKNKGDK